MMREAVGRATRHVDNVNVLIAIVIAGKGELAAIRGEFRNGFFTRG